MARRYNVNDKGEGEERPTSGPVSLAGLIRLQPSRKKISSKNWRPLRPSDFGGNERIHNDHDIDEDQGSTVASDLGSQQGPQPDRLGMLRQRASPFDLPPLQTDLGAPSGLLRHEDNMNRSSPYDMSSAHSNIGSEDISPTNTRHKVIDSYTRLFGKQLPDPIHLRVELGEFDGQVLFIGHPNRDVSAHQWSLSSYQWVNVGLYSHNRHRIEGSLASERLRGSSIPYNTIEYFKAAAEQRENAAWQSSHHDAPRLSVQANVQHLNALRQPTMNDAEHVPPLMSGSGSIHEHLRTLPQLDHKAHVYASTDRQAPTPDSGRVTRDTLEDPFISTSEKPRRTSPVIHHKEPGSGVFGSMDFEYVFPSPVSTVTARYSEFNNNAQKQEFWKREQERIEAMRRVALNGKKDTADDPLDSREPLNGLQASSMRVTQSYIPVSPEDAHNRQQLKTRLELLGEQAHRTSVHIDRRVAVPNVQDLQQQGSAMKHLRPPPGFTIANPHRITSTLNANAAPYTATGAMSAQSQQSSSSATEVEADPSGQVDSLAASLRFSDPGCRTPHRASEIMNFGDMCPTKQNWRGPFFSDDKPMTKNPSTSLAYHVEWKDKLENRSRDGQVPARQQESSRPITPTTNATASAANRGSDPQNQHKDTPIFIRMYENLSEYVETRPVHRQRDYFTRAWKPARPDQVDVGFNGNNSFFGESYNISSQQSPPVASQSTATTSNMSENVWTRDYSSGYVTDKGFESTRPGRFW